MHFIHFHPDFPPTPGGKRLGRSPFDLYVFDGFKPPLAPPAANAPRVGTVSCCFPWHRSSGIASSSGAGRSRAFSFSPVALAAVLLRVLKSCRRPPRSCRRVGSSRWRDEPDGLAEGCPAGSGCVLTLIYPPERVALPRHSPASLSGFCPLPGHLE